MVYVFELFATDLDGNRLRLESVKYRLKSTKVAQTHAETMMRNVLFKGKLATICVIKDQAGSVIGEVHMKPHANGNES